MKRNSTQFSLGKQINLGEILKTLIKNWYLFVLSLGIVLAGAIFYLKIATPKYSIKSTIIVKEGERNTNFSNNAIINDMESMKTSIKIENEIEQLRSNSLIMEVLKKQNAFVRYLENKEYFPKEIEMAESPVLLTIHEFNTSFNLPNEDLNIKAIGKDGYTISLENNSEKTFEFGEKINTKYGTISVQKNPFFNDNSETQALTILMGNTQLVTESYIKAFEFETAGPKSSILYINLEESSRERGKRIIDGLVQAYNESGRNEKHEMANRTIEFIDERLEYVIRDLNDLEKQIADYKRENEITDVDLDSKIFVEGSSVTENQISEVNNRIEILESLEGNLLSSNNQFELIPNSLMTLDDAIVNLLTRYNDLVREREKNLRTVSEKNPYIIGLDEQITSLRRSILTSVKEIHQSLLITKSNLEKNINKFNFKGQKLPTIERELIEIARQKILKQEHYQYLLKKREESTLALEVTGFTNAKIIDAPIASFQPIKPSKIKILGIASILGFLIPIGFLFLKYQFKTKVTSKQEVEENLSSPILGEIAKKENPGILAISSKSVTPTAEQLRLIRNNLKFFTGNENKVITITSSMPKDGKTFFAINLGVSLSLIDKKVIILDFDLRKPSILSSLGISHNPGVIDYLKSETSNWDQLIYHSDITENLDLMGVGKVTQNHAELINSYKVSELIENLKLRYDHIIIDTSPIGLVADAFALSKLTDAMIYVVKMKKTLLTHLNDMREIEDNKIFKNTLIVLNEVDKAHGKNFGYGYYGISKEMSTIS